MTATTVALVGAAGGAGTTRTAVETAAMLARDGRSVAVFDAAYATQGLAQYVDGRVDLDVTALVADRTDAELATALVELDLAVPGAVAVCPAHAPFERVARAKRATAARAFERRLAEAAAEHDHVLVDVPPVAANQSVAAVTAVERRVVVAPGTARGADALQRTRALLSDLGTTVDAAVSTRGELPAADAALPAGPPAVADAPACLGEDPFAEAVAEASAVVVDDELGVEFEREGRLARHVPGLGGE